MQSWEVDPLFNGYPCDISRDWFKLYCIVKIYCSQLVSTSTQMSPLGREISIQNSGYPKANSRAYPFVEKKPMIWLAGQRCPMFQGPHLHRTRSAYVIRARPTTPNRSPLQVKWVVWRVLCGLRTTLLKSWGISALFRKITLENTVMVSEWFEIKLQAVSNLLVWSVELHRPHKQRKKANSYIPSRSRLNTWICLLPNRRSDTMR